MKLSGNSAQSLPEPQQHCSRNPGVRDPLRICYFPADSFRVGGDGLEQLPGGPVVRAEAKVSLNTPSLCVVPFCQLLHTAPTLPADIPFWNFLLTLLSELSFVLPSDPNF